MKLKSILSILTMGLFIFLGFASIDEVDPETKIVNCEFLPLPVSIGQKCSFSAYDETGMPYVGLYINFGIKEYEKVDNFTECNLVLKSAYIKTLGFNSGTASFTLSKSYLSNDDMITIYFWPSLPGYDATPYNFILHKSDPGIIDFKIYLRKTEQNP